MITEKLLLHELEYDKSLQKAAEIIKKGGLVAMPTETVYGLAASCYDDEAIKKIFEAKGRPQDNPLIVHISDISQLYDVAVDIPESAIKCAEKFWPGPFTMVLKKSEKIAKSVSAGLQSVAVRMPDNTVARQLISKSFPLAAPSANISGHPSPTTAAHVIADLDGKIDAVLLSNDCKVGVESTVISLFGENPKLLRPGAVTLEQLREILPDIVVDKAVLEEPEDIEKVASPGMKYKHYAPNTEAYLVEGTSQQFADFVNEEKDACAVCFDEESDIINIKKICYGSCADEKTLAQNVFSVLRKVDEMNLEKIYIHAPSKSGVGLAVYNRLIRAAAFRVIKL